MKPHESPRIRKKSIRGDSGDSWPVWNRGIRNPIDLFSGDEGRCFLTPCPSLWISAGAFTQFPATNICFLSGYVL